MTKLERYVEEKNAAQTALILRWRNRAPRPEELIDLKTAAGQAWMLQHLECALEDESLLQDGERSRAEAAADERKYHELLHELQNYGVKRKYPANLYMFEGQLRTVNEVAKIYTACSKETIRRMLTAGNETIAEFNTYAYRAAQNKKRGSIKGSETTEKLLGLRIPKSG